MPTVEAASPTSEPAVSSHRGLSVAGSDPLGESKERARRAARARRALLAPGEPEAASRHLLTSDLCRAGSVVSGYVAVKNEFDPAPLLRALAAAGLGLCLPSVVERRQALVFRAWAPGIRLVAAAYGVQEPAPDAPVVEPDLLIVPLLAFDRRGHRLGYGGGYYDRAIATLRRSKPVVAVGFAHAGQEIEAVPAGPEDQPLDWVATEAGLIRCG